MEMPGAWPRVKSLSEDYFDHEQFAADVREQTGFTSQRHQALCVAMSHTTYWRVCRGERRLSLEQYVEICALLNRPLGSWIRYCEHEPR